MAINRTHQICLETTPFYHCYVRCVRRAFLCGEDQTSGDNYDHRKQWIVSRLKFLSYVYAIDICAYAVMSNHYHVVLHIDKQRARGWSQLEVVERWMQICAGNLLVDRWLEKPEDLSQSELDTIDETIEIWRERLFSVSWFMRCVNETIARMANEEDSCKGRFWEGRFKSQALLDDAAVLSCMAYVDLNPVRASLTQDLNGSDFTSIQQRLYDLVENKKQRNYAESHLVQRVKQQQSLKMMLKLHQLPQAPLMSFSASRSATGEAVLPIEMNDYIGLLEDTKDLFIENKQTLRRKNSVKFLQRYGINPDRWLEHIKFFNLNYSFCVGNVNRMRYFLQLYNKSLGKGAFASKQVYQSISGL